MDKEIDDVLKRLPPGWGIISHPRGKTPFLVSTKLVSLPKVSDEQLRAYMQPFWQKFPPVLIGKSPEEKADDLRLDLRQLMMEVANHPGMSSSEYCKALGWAASKGTRIKKQLESLQLIKCHSIPMARRGGGVEAIELLRTAFEKLGLPPAKLPGKGGFIHAWWIGRLAKVLAKQKPVIEKDLNGKAVDLAVEAEGWIAYEVQRDCRQDLVRDLLSKDLKAGFIRVVLCVESKEEVVRVGKIVLEMGHQEKVEVRLLADFYTQGG